MARSILTTRPWWFKLALACALVALLLWWLGAGRPVGQAPATQPPSLVVAATASAGPAGSAALGKLAALTQASALSDQLCGQLAESESASSATGAGSTASTASSPARFAASPAQREAISAMLGKLAQDTDPARRATGLSLSAEWAAREAVRQLLVQYPNCEKDGACREQMQAAASNAYASRANQLAQQALTSRDPVLYASAFYTCYPRDTEQNRPRPNQNSAPFCQQISPAQWAERDPHNALPWVFAAQQVHDKPAELEQVLFRWSQAKRFDRRLVGLPQLHEAQLLAQQDGAVQLELARLNHQVLRLHPPPEFAVAINYCRLDQPETSNRRAVCEAIAGQLLTDQTLVVTGGLGTQIGQQLGWDTARLLQMAKTQRQGGPGSASATSLATSSAPATPASAAKKECLDSVKSARAELNTMQYGELDTWRKKLDPGLATQMQLQEQFSQFMLKGPEPPDPPRPTQP